MLSLTGKNILVTGGLGSLGRAEVKTLAKAGGTVYLLDIDEEKGNAFAVQANASLENSSVFVKFIAGDLKDLEISHDQIRTLAEEIGGLDILVNNAAIIVNKPIEDYSIAEYETILRVNAHAAFALTKAVLPEMKEKKAGRIINMCSVTLNGEWADFVPYVASKGELLGLTRSLARELGPWNITVNAVSPGAIPSEAEQRVFGDKWDEYNRWVLDRQSLKYRGNEEDISNAILFFASDMGKFVTGQNLHVNGGWLMEG